MEFLIQLPWQRKAPDAFGAALVFMCKREARTGLPCETQNAALGANAVILLRDVIPIEPKGLSSYPAFGVRWRTCKEPQKNPWAMDLFESERAVSDREEDEFINTFGWTKLGGEVMWMKNPEVPVCAACGGETIFAAQFDSALGFTAAGGRVMVKFGKGGVGYLFLCARQCSERGGAFLWQSP